MRSKTYRRFSAEFTLGVVKGVSHWCGILKALATKAGVDHSLVHSELKKYHAGDHLRACDVSAWRGCRMFGRPRSTYSRRARVVAADADADADADASLRDAIANEPAESPPRNCEIADDRWRR